MPAIINHSYLDFFTIDVDAYNSKNQNIYRKLMTTTISTYKALTNEFNSFQSSNCERQIRETIIK